MSMPKIQIINPNVLKAKGCSMSPGESDMTLDSIQLLDMCILWGRTLQWEQRTVPSQDIRMPGKEPVCRLSTVQASPQWWKWVFLFSNKRDKKKGANNSQFPKTKLRNSTDKEVMTTQTVLALLERSESCCFRKKFSLSLSLISLSQDSKQNSPCGPQKPKSHWY